MNKLIPEEAVPKLNNKEFTSALEFQIHHRCPWYRRWFMKELPSFSYIEYNTGIGNRYDIICDVCGKMRDITDYDSW